MLGQTFLYNQGKPVACQGPHSQDAENTTVEGIAACKQQVNMNSIIFIAVFLVIGGLGKPSLDNDLTDGIDEEEMQADIEAQFKSINVSWSKHMSSIGTCK